MSENTVRTFSIAEDSYNNVCEICNVFHITHSTVYRMAIYNGIKRIINSYLPMRYPKNKRKIKKKVSIPQDGWDLFDLTVEKVKYNWNEFIPDGELFNIFLDMEVRHFHKYLQPDSANEHHRKEKLSDAVPAEVKRLYEYLQQNASDKGEKYDEDTIPVSFTVDVPKAIYEEIEIAQQVSGVAVSQVWKYVTYYGLLDEYNMNDVHMIFTHKDIVEEIDTLGLPRLKAFTLLNYLIKSGIITWNSPLQ